MNGVCRLHLGAVSGEREAGGDAPSAAHWHAKSACMPGEACREAISAGGSSGTGAGCSPAGAEPALVKCSPIDPGLLLHGSDAHVCCCAPRMDGWMGSPVAGQHCITEVFRFLHQHR